MPRPGSGQLLLQVRANALCGSERGQFYEGTSITPGHEAAGVVVAAGPDTQTPVGTPGVVFLMDFCGECRSCRLGLTNQCLAKCADMGFNQDGGYGPYELVNENIFFPVDADIPLGVEDTVRRYAFQAAGSETAEVWEAGYFNDRDREFHRTFDRHVDDLLRAFRRGEPPPIPAETGRRALVLAYAAIESYQSGRRVSVAAVETSAAP